MPPALASPCFPRPARSRTAPRTRSQRVGHPLNPIAAIAHLLAIAAGVWGGLWLMGKVTPDLPPADAAPGVASAVEQQVAGDDATSLFRSIPLSAALDQLAEQQAAGTGFVRLHIEPGSLQAETSGADGGFQPADVPPGALELIVAAAAAERPQVNLRKVRYADLVATAQGPRWYVQLDSGDPSLPPPWTYGAPLSGEPVTVGPGEPRPIEAD